MASKSVAPVISLMVFKFGPSSRRMISFTSMPISYNCAAHSFKKSESVFSGFSAAIQYQSSEFASRCSQKYAANNSNAAAFRAIWFQIATASFATNGISRWFVFPTNRKSVGKSSGSIFPAKRCFPYELAIWERMTRR